MTEIWECQAYVLEINAAKSDLTFLFLLFSFIAQKQAENVAADQSLLVQFVDEAVTLLLRQ